MPHLERKGNIINSFVSRFLPRIPQTNLGGVAQTGVEVSRETVLSNASPIVEMTGSCRLRNSSFEDIQAEMLQRAEAYQRMFICERDHHRVLIPSSNLERVGGHYRITVGPWKERAAEAEKSQSVQSNEA